MKKLMFAAVAAVAFGASAESVYNLSLTVKTAEKDSRGGYVKPATVKVSGLKVENEYIIWTGSGKKAELVGNETGIVGGTTKEVGSNKMMADWTVDIWNLQGVGGVTSISGNFTGSTPDGTVEYGAWSAKQNKSVEKKLAEGKSLTEAYKFPAGIAEEVEKKLAGGTDFQHLINNATTLADYAAIAKSANEIALPKFVAASNELVEAYAAYTNSTKGIEAELAALEKEYNAAVDAYQTFPEWKPADSKASDPTFEQATNNLVEATKKVDERADAKKAAEKGYLETTNDVALAVKDLEEKAAQAVTPEEKADFEAQIVATNKWKVSADCPTYVALTNTTKLLDSQIAFTNTLQGTVTSISNAYMTCETLLRGYAKSYFDSMDEKWQKANQYLDKDGNIISKANFVTCYEGGYAAKKAIVEASKNTKQWNITQTLKKGDVILKGDYLMTVAHYKQGYSEPEQASSDYRASEDTYIFEKGDYILAAEAVTAAAKDLEATTKLASDVQLKQEAVAKGADEAQAVKDIEGTNKVGVKFTKFLSDYVDNDLIKDLSDWANENVSGYTLTIIKGIVAE